MQGWSFAESTQIINETGDNEQEQAALSRN